MDRSIIKTVQDVLAGIEKLVVHYDPESEQPQCGRFVPFDQSRLHPAVVEAIRDEYADGMYTHQHEAIGHVLDAKNTVVATRTSSGKSLIYSLPVMDALARDPESTALFLFPMKALANDQLFKLQSLSDRVAPVAKLRAKNPHLVARYDGSTDSDLKPIVRETGQIILTTPDMLHLSLLQSHERLWKRFFKRLKLVAIDECHEYRGVFGTNVACILHRLRQVCTLHGSRPRFVATSATIRDPQEHLQRLTGVPFQCVDAESDGSRQGRRKFWMVGSSDHYYDTGRKLAIALAQAGLSVLAFCPGRVSAERMLARAVSTQELGQSYVRVYRSGLDAQQREEIERGLRDRSVRLVFSTSALELGIDIGAIDVVVCIGLPHSMMSMWQRAGRAARGGREGAIVFVPADTPIDTYFANHPDELFKRDHEPLVLNLTNRRLVCQHYACAVQEVGGDDDQLRVDNLGDEIRQVRDLRKSGQLNRDEFYRADPHKEINIRSAGEGSYSLMVGDDEIGKIDSFHLLREAFRNAIYRHGGRAYRVKDVIRGRRIVRLKPEFSRNDTSPTIQKKIRLKKQYTVAEFSAVRVSTASLDVTEFLVAASERDISGKTVRTWQGSQGMPAHQLPTEGTLLALKKEFWLELTNNLNETGSTALQSAERLLCSLFPTVTGPVDSQDYSSGIDTLPTGERTIFLYDLVYDGADITKAAFDQMQTLIERAIERVHHCDCESDEGCWRCIANPLVNQAVSKKATRYLLTAIRDILAREQPQVMHFEKDWTVGLMPELAPACPNCNQTVLPGARFCPNCGLKMAEV